MSEEWRKERGEERAKVEERKEGGGWGGRGEPRREGKREREGGAEREVSGVRWHGGGGEV